METRIHSTCGHARASTARPRGMEINIKSNSGKDLRGGAISLATHGSGSPPVPETEAPKKAPQRHLEPKCAPGCVAGVSRVCRAVFKLRAWIPQQPQPPLTPIGSCRDLHIPPNSRSTAPLRRPLSSWSCSYLARAETLRAPRCTGLVLRTHGACEPPVATEGLPSAATEGISSAATHEISRAATREIS